MGPCLLGVGLDRLPSVGKVFDHIDESLAAWLRAQPVFFVATAPLAADGLLNCSPKGLQGTFAVLDDHRVGYLDLTGSGVETIAHLRDNGRIVLMFCAFDGRPRIVRLHGRGKVVLPDDERFDALLPRFSDHPGVRSVIVVDVARIADSCGYAVPRLDYVEDRDILDLSAAKKGPEKLAAYRRERNEVSLDGLPALSSGSP
ncbi:pyridoxamine 5'-phosphate oxidase family protein [soil metagenome]